MRHIVAAVLMLASLCTATAVAQTATTSLRGVVKDSSGALVPGASITLLDKATNNTYHAVSSASGYYIFPIVVPAHYLITTVSSGFAPQTRTAELLVEQPATIDFTLGVAADTVTVDVSAATQTLNFTDATMGNSVGNATIQALPMDGRNPISLLELQPGVLYIGDNTDSRQGAVAGGRSDQGNITLDGLDDNDQIGGAAFTTILRSTLDSTEEFRVVTSNGTAQAGRSSGAQVNLVTKSGTNKYHGALYEYYRPTNTVANSFFNKNSEILSGEPNIPQKYIVNTFGGSIGGPIKKDKLFYFFNYEGQRIGTGSVVGATVPMAGFMQGELSYPDTNGNTQTLSPAQVAQLDAPCTGNTFNGAPVCPAGPGPNAAILSYYAKVPVATGTILGDGYNSGSFYFVSPTPSTQNTSILKIDYNLNSANRIFVRGNLQKDTASGAENLPGQPPASYTDDNTKGISAGYTWTPTANMVNDLRYGFIRQGYQVSGIGSGDYVGVYGLTQPTAQTRNTILHVPVNNITDTFTWVKGTHTIALGGNWRGITNENGSDANSFDGASTNEQYANTSDLPLPSNIASSFASDSWMYAYGNLVGVVPEVYKVYNYKISSPTSGTALPDGTFVNRDYRSNEFEYFLQDTWHARHNLTLTFGLRHTLLQTPYETHGQQISPTIDTDAWYKERESAALQSQIYEPTVYLAPSGKANGQPGYWPKQKDNVAPRIGIVFAPDPKTSIRASFGIYYDHYGEALANTFSQEGAIGLNAGISNGADELGFENAPRFTGPHNIPDISLPPFSPTISFPNPPPIDGFGIDWGIDNRLKTPYAESFNLSVQHEFPGGFVFEEAYVGRLGRHLLQQLDLAEPVDYVDPQGGGDYFSNARTLSAAVDAAPFGTFNGNRQKVNSNVTAIPYFENVFPYMKNHDYGGESATQAIFNNAWAPERYTNGETFSLVMLDFAPYGFFPGIPTQSRFFSNQFSSLYSWDSIGTSSYNALQFTLRHPASHGLTVDVSYTFSKSLDLGSETERTSQLGNTDDAYTNFAIQNTWNPKLNKGPSDFDTHSLITGDWVYALPVGRGKAVLCTTNHLVDALIGGWQWAGLARWTSGLPFTLESPAYPSNYNNPGFAFNVGNVQTHRNITAGVPHVFDAATVSAINNGIYFGNTIRLPYAGEAGSRNNFRGDGYFDIDSSLTKSWNLGNLVKLKFAGELYNVSNSDRFDVSVAGLNARTASTLLGTYSGNLSTYRRMQFGLRLDF
ncbi:TonB-dependent receptor [Granulicella sp. S156]|uniref:TonB-dependent receptor n=1 Tax=Granulicella sp. S156 TaxID=1747224 RepID=UPI00131DE816|nr:TonB-dependent receptor [Granulicella sp. S156]